MKKIIFLLLTGLIINMPALTVSAAKSASQQTFSQAELEQMLAPIALYPDSVLTHILIASTYPLEIVQANRLIEKKPNLTTKSAIRMAEDKNWDVSVKALIPFPRILNRLSEDLEWTQNLGEAFLQDEEQVLDSIQSLRYKAKQAGNLDQIENMKITQESEHIIIEPVRREYVYIPYYDPRVVYGSWHWRHHPPIYWTSSYHSSHYLHSRRFGWYPRVHLSSFDFFFSTFHWHNRHVIRLGHHHYNHHYRHRYYPRASIIRHASAQRWRHNQYHRRGVGYRHYNVRQRYGRNSSGIHKPRQRLQSGALNHGRIKYDNKIKGHKPRINHRANHKPRVNHKPKANHKPRVNHKPKANHKPRINHKPRANYKPRTNHNTKKVQTNSQYKRVQSNSEYKKVQSNSRHKRVQSNSEYKKVQSSSRHKRVQSNSGHKRVQSSSSRSNRKSHSRVRK